MPRRAAVKAPPPPSIENAVDTSGQSSLLALNENVILLRKQWKWAAFSQFFFTFSQLFNLPDITLNAIEEDLTRGMRLVLPRIMARLLYTLSYDRKVNVDNWQTALRRQYYKRDPSRNPIGPEPEDDFSVSSRESTPEQQEEVKGEDQPATEEASVRSSNPPSDENAGSPADKDDLLGERNISVLPEAHQTPLSKDEEPGHEASRDWFDLDMLAKLDSLHLLTEWQFHNATRLRQIMRTDDDNAEWRIEPIGYDAKKNAYWLIGADRLWIQRVLPRATTNLKRKRPPPKSNARKQAPRAKRPKLQSRTTTSSRSTSKAARLATPEIPASGRGGRAAKQAANVRLETQAKELAQLNREAAAQERESHGARVSKRLKGGDPPSSRPLGTRLSSRLRGKDQDEGWQPVPREWLQGDDDSELTSEGDDEENSRLKIKGKFQANGTLKTGLETDDGSGSELTELSDSGSSSEDEKENDDGIDDTAQEEEEPINHVKEGDYPADFVEWETICVTLYEWEHIAEQWEGAKHYLEKALHKTLKNRIAPVIIEELREEERQRQMAEAVTHRKRSSRLAIRESEKEQQKLLAHQKAEEEEKMGRARRAEARERKEQSDRDKRDTAREQRRKDREAREEAEALALAEQESAEAETKVDIVTEEPVSKPKPSGRSRAKPKIDRQSTSHSSHSPHPSHTPPSTWELDCEVCQRRGVNVNDGHPVIPCQTCRKYHHARCLDRVLEQNGMPRRDWARSGFICARCRHSQPPQYVNPNYPNAAQSQYSNYNGRGSPNYDYTAYGQRRYSNGHIQPPMQDPRYGQFQVQPNTSFHHYQPQQRSFYVPDTYPATPAPTAYPGQSSQRAPEWNGATASYPYQGSPTYSPSKGYTSPTQAHYPQQYPPSGGAGSQQRSSNGYSYPPAQQPHLPAPHAYPSPTAHDRYTVQGSYPRP